MSQAEKRSSIFILTRSLNVGGTERQVSVLAKALHQKGYKVTIGVFYSGGTLEDELKKAGVAIYSLEKKGRWDLIGWFRRYLKAVRETNPDVIYSFLTTSNIVAVGGRLFIAKPIVWGIRASNMQGTEYDWLARACLMLEKNLSKFVKTVIFNAQSSLQYHKSLGYCLHNPVVIPNGIDTDRFKPDLASRERIRKKLGIPQNAKAIGMLARVDPMKDYETYLAAARLYGATHDNVYFIAAGHGTDTAFWPSKPKHFYGLGVWEDVSGLLNALDIMVLSSAFGEGFPNVVGEAMACGIPTIATDVGDASYVLADLGSVIPPKNPEALVQAINTLLEKEPSRQDLRNRILSNFSVPQMVDRTLETLAKACGSS